MQGKWLRVMFRGSLPFAFAAVVQIWYTAPIYGAPVSPHHAEPTLRPSKSGTSPSAFSSVSTAKAYFGYQAFVEAMPSLD